MLWTSFCTVQFCIRYGDLSMEGNLSRGQIQGTTFSPNDLRSSKHIVGSKNVLFDEKHMIITASFLK